ncbi:hypothetical protein BD413DRAFT_71122 [Trametes elegans]|nr:hypothetical protein BD413DRAFT_71122 [Trametes elegans]
MVLQSLCVLTQSRRCCCHDDVAAAYTANAGIGHSMVVNTPGAVWGIFSTMMAQYQKITATDLLRPGGIASQNVSRDVSRTWSRLRVINTKGQTVSPDSPVRTRTRGNLSSWSLRYTCIVGPIIVCVMLLSTERYILIPRCVDVWSIHRVFLRVVSCCRRLNCRPHTDNTPERYARCSMVREQ